MSTANMVVAASESETLFRTINDSTDLGIAKSMARTLNHWLDNIFDGMTDIVADLAANLGRGASALLVAARDTIASFSGQVLSAIQDGIGFALSALAAGAAKIFETIEAGFNAVTDFIRNAAGTIADVVMDAVDGLAGFIGDALLGMQDLIDTAIEVVLDLAASGVSIVGNVIDDVLDSLSLTFELVQDAAIAVLDGVVDSLVGFVDEVGDALSATVDSIVSTTESLGAALAGGLDSLGFVLDAFASTLPDSLLLGVGGPIGEAIKELLSGLLASVGLTTDTPEGGLTGTLDALLALSRDDRPQFEDALALVRESFAQSPFFALVANVLVSPLIAWQILSGVAAVTTERVKQDYSEVHPHVLPGIADLVEAVVRGRITEEEFTSKLARHGVGEIDRETLRGNRDNLPTVFDQTTWMHRGFQTKAEATERLELSGWLRPDAEKIIEASFVLPPPQDLITMAVREVFSPATAELFGQFEDFPQPFAEHAAQQGISEEWAQRYWAAHWRLPSAGQGFEMLHRGIIQQAQLEQLLKALDVMPFWRGRMIQLSFRPLTRVDVRRMHKLGVLERAAVVRSYLDLGYSPENAERMTVFTEVFNEESEAGESETVKGLTRASIVTAFTVGIFSRAESLDQMLDAGFTLDAAESFLEIAEIQVELDRREVTKRLILSQFRAGVISFSEGQDAGARAGFETVEMSLLELAMLREEESNIRQPSRADLDRMLRKQVIGDDTYLRGLQTLGYSAEWAARYRALVT